MVAVAAARGGDVAGARRLPRSEIVVTALIAPVAVAVVIARLPAIVLSTLWAEDGRVFLADRLSAGPLVSIFTPYDGYLHVVPRLIAEVLVPTVPLDGYAWGVSVVCATITGLVAALVFRMSADIVQWVPARAALALLVVVAPTAPLEVLGNTANLHWILLWAALWLVVGRARSTLGSLVMGFVALVIALSEIQVVVLLPLMWGRWRDRRAWPVAAGLLLGLGAQTAALLTSPRDSLLPPPLSAESLLQGYLVQPVLATVIGSSRQALWGVGTSGPWLPLLVLVGLLGVLALILLRGDGRQRVLASALVVGSFVLWVAAATVNARNEFDYAAYDDGRWSLFAFVRYSFIGSVLLLALLPLAASILRQRGRRAPWAVLGVVAVIAASSFVVEKPMRWDGPYWDAGVAAAREQCELDEYARASIPIAPPTWTADVPCQTLLPG